MKAYWDFVLPATRHSIDIWAFRCSHSTQFLVQFFLFTVLPCEMLPISELLKSFPHLAVILSTLNHQCLIVIASLNCLVFVAHPFSSPTDHTTSIFATMVITASASMIEISPYFEPGAPPPTLPILIAQTEIGNAQTPGKLVAQEEIGSGPTVARLPYPKRHTTPSHFPLRSSTPKLKFTSKSSKRPNTTSVSLDESVNSESESSLSSLSDSESDDELLIPKPKGEAGRPGRGGYNLENTLGWEGKDYQKMKVIFTCYLLILLTTLA